MIEIRHRQITIDGVPRIVMCGEIHYFRLARGEWADRLLALRDAGCTAVASYIPWLWHELPGGDIDVSGRTRPERDVAAFIDLCHDMGLWFVARPGPFVMAELKNEGLPYRLYTEHPEIVPVGWDGGPAPSRTVDYLAPAYLAEVRRWYEAIMPVLAERLEPLGGNVIAVQLDNEVGMLAWVTNSPDLTDHLLSDLLAHLRDRYGDALAQRYPVDLADPDAWGAAVRSPKEEWAAALRVDLGTFMRGRFACYLAALREYAVACGVHGVPFVVNIHGTEHGGAASFPIGISQLMDGYRGLPGTISGSDHYVGDMTLRSTTDLYVLNAYSAAVHDADQPLTSVEFEAGRGDYGGSLDQQYDPACVDLKTRLFVAQGNRLINYYLFAGGVNPMLDEPVGDGNDRISFTGEWHGTGAPVEPDGTRGYPYPPTVRAVAAVRANEPWLAAMREEHDDLALGFVPDSYLTEYRYPGSAVTREITDDLIRYRGAGEGSVLARSLLLAGYRFGAVDLQRDGDLPAVVALATGVHLDAAVQRRLAGHVAAGGGLLLYGPVPGRDLEGRPCTVLADALGIAAGRMITGDHRYYPSVAARSWAAPMPETRVGWLQEVTGGDPLFVDPSTGAACCVETGRAGQAGQGCAAGRAVVLAAGLPSVPALFRTAAERLGATPGLTHDAPVPGLFATTTVDDAGGRLVHVLNVSGYPNPTRLWLAGTPLLDGRRLHVPPRTGLMLPLDLRLPAATIRRSTAEISGGDTDHLSFRMLQDEETVVLETDRRVRADRPCHIDHDGRLTTLTAHRETCGEVLTAYLS
jgi:beta-galactosidase